MDKYILLLLISVSVLVLLGILSISSNYVLICEPGELEVIDGDTFRWHGKKIRIYGIDTLELTKQKKWVLKYTNKRNYTCLKYYAYRAKEILERLFSSYCIKIEFFGYDKYGRILAKVYNCTGEICTDIGEYMVINGLAISFGDVYKYADNYAKQKELGFWSCD